MNRRLFLALSSMGMSLSALGRTRRPAAMTQITPTSQTPLEISVLDTEKFLEADLETLQQKMSSGEVTSRYLTAHYLDRIEHHNSMGPKLHAVILKNQFAGDEAAARDDERAKGQVRGPLHGIPVLVKDNIDTAGLTTTAGWYGLTKSLASRDAFIIRQLRNAGAVVLGKANLSEWANFRSTHSISGWSSAGGQTKNPYVLDRDPSGSSSGSAVAVAANLCAVAIGTETDGSIISPASHCGIVGLKPTVGLLSRSGIVPISATQDTAGPMARTVRDCAHLLGAMLGYDTDDSAMKSSAPGPIDLNRALQLEALRNKRIGYDPAFSKGLPAVKSLYQESLDVVKNLGAELIPCDILSSANKAGEAEWTVLLYEFKDGVNRYLKTVKNADLTLANIIAYNNKFPSQMMPFFQQEILELSQECGDLNDVKYRKALHDCAAVRSSIDALIKRHGLDAMCGISTGPAGCIDVVHGDYSTGPSFCSPAAIAGYPHITVPCGFIRDLPVGFSFMSTAWTESALLGMAYSFEQATKKRRLPEFLPTIKL